MATSDGADADDWLHPARVQFLYAVSRKKVWFSSNGCAPDRCPMVGDGVIHGYWYEKHEVALERDLMLVVVDGDDRGHGDEGVYFDGLDRFCILS